MNRVRLYLFIALLALALPTAAHGGDGRAHELPSEIHFECDPDEGCEPRPESCEIGSSDYHLPPAREICFWLEKPCLDDADGCFPVDNSCFLSEDEQLSEKCLWLTDPCDLAVSSDGGYLPDPTSLSEGDVQDSDNCDFPEFPYEHCYVKGFPGESEGYEGPDGEAGWVDYESWDDYEEPEVYESWDDHAEPEVYEDHPPEDEIDYPDYDEPGAFFCFSITPAGLWPGGNPRITYKGDRAFRKERAQARRKAARKRAQARRKAAARRAQARRKVARKRAAAKRKELKGRSAARGLAR